MPQLDLIPPSAGLGDLATTVTLAGVGGYIVLRLLKSLSGRLDADESRMRAQEDENFDMRAKVLELSSALARSETQVEALKDSIRQLYERERQRAERDE